MLQNAHTRQRLVMSLLSGAACAACGDIETLPTRAADTPTSITEPRDIPLPDSDLTTTEDAMQLVTRAATPVETILYEAVLHAITDTVVQLTSTTTATGDIAFHGVLRELAPATARTVTIPCADDSGSATITITGAITSRAIAADITATYTACRVVLTGDVTNQSRCTVSATLDGELACALTGASTLDPLNLQVACATPRICTGLQITTTDSAHTFGTALTLAYQKSTLGVISVQDAFAPTGFACIDSVGLETTQMLQLAQLSATAVGCE